MMVGRVSFWDCLFSGAMLNFRGVRYQSHMDLSCVPQEGGMNELDAATVMQQILRGVAYMHNHKCLGWRKLDGGFQKWWYSQIIHF